MSELAVPTSLRRRADEVEGWLELGCPQVAREKVETLLAVPGARAVGLFLRVRANVELNDYATSLRDLEELRPLHHDPEWFDLTEAWCRKRTGQLTEAMQCMERLLRRQPSSAIGHFNLGCYLALLGDAETAIRSLGRACLLDATFRGVPMDDPDLDSLRARSDFVAMRHCIADG